MTDLPLTGSNLLGSAESAAGPRTLRSRDRRGGPDLDVAFAPATPAEVDAATRAAADELDALDHPDPVVRADVVDAVARAVEAHGEQITAAADRETALGRPRLEGELARTVGQLRTYAAAVRRGDDLERVETPADPGAGRPLLVRTSVAVGPVAVFGAGNFPLAFGAVGTDTAAALAAGCPVVVKGHPSHPATTELCVRAARAGLATHGRAAALSLVHGDAEAGIALVTAPPIAAVAFTGSLAAGRALAEAAAQRPDPIPVHAEMGSINPVVVTAGAAGSRPAEVGAAVAAAVAGSAGQLCTKPGVLLVPAGDGGQAVVDALVAAVADAGPFVLLDERIEARLAARLAELSAAPGVRALARPAAGGDGVTLLEVDMPAGAEAGVGASVAEEAFGPAAVVVRYHGLGQVPALLAALGGQLTVTVQGDDAEVDALGPLLRAASRHAGRVVWNGVPTGVAVVDAMHHGGPWPASSSARGSVGPEAVLRFRRPLAWQGFPPGAWRGTLLAQPATGPTGPA